MPMQSVAQRKWMWANKPKMARRWEDETPDGKKLPARKGKRGDFAIKGLKRAAQKCKDCGKAKCECDDEDEDD